MRSAALSNSPFASLTLPEFASLWTTIKASAFAEAFMVVNHLRTHWNHILEEITYWYELLRRRTSISSLPVAIGTVY